jgi:hypothetical protein
MQRGIRFKVPNEWGTIINFILENIQLRDYIFNISNDEIHLEKEGFLFNNEDVMEGEVFENLISQSKYYALFANIQRYPKDSIVKNIKTYDDFLKSDCDLIVIIVDGTFVDIFVKFEKDFIQIANNAKKNNFIDIEYITEKNDIIKNLSCW